MNGIHRRDPAPLVIVPLASKDVYLSRYAEPYKGWTDLDEARWPVPYWYIDTGFAALLILLAVVDEGLGAVFFGPPEFADFRAAFGVPGQWTPIGAIAVCHFDPARPARPRLTRRRAPPCTHAPHRSRQPHPNRFRRPALPLRCHIVAVMTVTM